MTARPLVLSGSHMMNRSIGNQSRKAVIPEHKTACHSSQTPVWLETGDLQA
ncbi:hypothetical protein [Sorlinia euscelidii]|uniref:hypothetical protein n=1 Tax=Sorlinia euscelidii TaxID=3081148 RepID=UPI00374DFBE8